MQFGESARDHHNTESKAIAAKHTVTGMLLSVLIAGGILSGFFKLTALADAGDRMIVTAQNGVYVRSAPSEDGEIAGSCACGDIVTVQEDDGGDWILIYGGYVKREYLGDVPEGAEAQDSEEEPDETAEPDAGEENTDESAGESEEDSDYAEGWDEEKGEAVAEYAKQFVGLPYVWGGESLETGCDCSGFTRAVYAHFDVDLPHYDVYQRSCGEEVESVDEAKPGDLVFYENHVTIYIGRGEVVNCSTEELGTLITKVDYKAVEMVRRIFCN